MAVAQGVVEDEDVAVFAAALGHHVVARDAEIHAAGTHADHDVAGALEEHGEVGHGGNGSLQLAGVGLVDAQPGAFQQVEGFGCQPAFAGQGKANFGAGLGGHGHSPKTKAPPWSGGAWCTLR